MSWCIVHVRTEGVRSVAAAIADLLGPPSALDVFEPPGFRVQVDRNPDRTRSEHPLDWPTQIDIDAAPGADLPTFTTSLLHHLHATGHQATPEFPPSHA